MDMAKKHSDITSINNPKGFKIGEWAWVCDESKCEAQKVKIQQVTVCLQYPKDDNVSIVTYPRRYIPVSMLYRTAEEAINAVKDETMRRIQQLTLGTQEEIVQNVLAFADQYDINTDVEARNIFKRATTHILRTLLIIHTSTIWSHGDMMTEQERQDAILHLLQVSASYGIDYINTCRDFKNPMGPKNWKMIRSFYGLDFSGKPIK